MNVTVNGDVKAEPNETLLVNLSAPTNATILDGQGTGTITNDDGAPTLSINDVSVAEGNAGTTTLGFTVTLSAVSGQTVTVDYATANGTATTADGDYLAASGTLTFAPGVTTQPVNVTVNGDVKDEPNETFLVNLSVPDQRHDPRRPGHRHDHQRRRRPRRSRSTTSRSPRATRGRRRWASPSRSPRRAGRPSRSATRPPTGRPRRRTATTSPPPGRSPLLPASRPSP